MPVQVPAQYVEPLKFMSMNTGIPYQVCAAQASEESGFQQYVTSPAGAEGWLQFEPATFAQYGGGSIWDIWNQANAYVGYMNHLLRVFRGSILWALAGYNAGEGNPQAGLGYARTVLLIAQTGTGISGDPASLGAPQFQTPPLPVTGADDWSDTIRHAAGWFNDQGRNNHSTGYAIRRM